MHSSHNLTPPQPLHDMLFFFDIGRSPDLSQFVKHMKEDMDAYTEIDLLRQNTIVTVRRTINSENKGSKWNIDGRKASEKEVKAIMVELAIDVDNLCSFMPQDKVPSKLIQFVNIEPFVYSIITTSIGIANNEN